MNIGLGTLALSYLVCLGIGFSGGIVVYKLYAKKLIDALNQKVDELQEKVK